MIYFTSDTHFNHDRGFIYEPRGFNSIEEANRVLFDNWNSTVAPEDDVYMLGDFFLGTDMEWIKSTLSKLHGRIHFIRGNHDTPAKIAIYKDAENVVEIVDAKYFNYAEFHFYLSHFPTDTSNLDETDISKAIFNLHGHTHSHKKFYQGRPYLYNVAVDAQGNKPVSIIEVIGDICREIELCYSFLK